MSQLWGIDCQHNGCVHDSVRAYRLRFMVRPTGQCMRCGSGEPIPPEQMAVSLGVDPNDPHERDEALDWYRCPRSTPCEQPWRRRWQQERTDMIFRAFQLDAALAQMEVLGVAGPGLGAHLSAMGHQSLPPGFEQRMMRLTEEPMPRCAVYFRWRPDTGQILTPDLVLQGIFAPDMTSEQRRNANAQPLTEAELSDLLRVDEGYGRGAADIVRVSVVKCQHCHRRLPLRTFNTMTLREVAWGD